MKLSNQKKLKDASWVDTSNLAAKKIFVLWKLDFTSPDVNKLVNVPSDLINLKTNVDDLDVDTLKTTN